MASITKTVAGVKPPPPGSLRWRLWHAFTQVHALLYRVSGGRAFGSYAGAPVLLLHHLGRKSGAERRSPLLYMRDGDDFVIVASMGGSEVHPAWYLNLEAHPDTAIEVDGETIAVEARTASSEEKARLWPRIVETYDGYETYQKRTSRDIPVLILRPSEG